MEHNKYAASAGASTMFFTKLSTEKQYKLIGHNQN
jgi:hypothetical protein